MAKYFKNRSQDELIVEAKTRYAELKKVLDQVEVIKKNLALKRKLQSKLEQRLSTVTHWIKDSNQQKSKYEI